MRNSYIFYISFLNFAPLLLRGRAYFIFCDLGTFGAVFVYHNSYKISADFSNQ